MPCAFVAMPFAQKFYPVYQSIKSACEQLGVSTLRIDEVWARDDIYQQIEEEILKSDFVIADFTGDRMMEVPNPNVVHEATFARVNKKYMVLLAQDHKCLPFDWRTRPAIIYQDTKEGLQYLGERLRIAIQALLQKPDFGHDNRKNAPPVMPSFSYPQQPAVSAIPSASYTPLPFSFNPMMQNQQQNVSFYESSPAGIIENLLRSREKKQALLAAVGVPPLPQGFRKEGDLVLCEADGSSMAWIPESTFMMGAAEEEDQGPVHEVDLSSYLIDIHPVSIAQYQKFLEAGGYQYPGFWTTEGWKWRIENKIEKPATFPQDPLSQANFPVTGVSWYEAMAYSAWAGKHLPTEAQWEYAARGKDQRTYPWGNKKPTSKLANYKGKSKGTGEKKGPSEREKFSESVSPSGCYDMAGNVWEWCYDWYLEDYYQSSPRLNPIGPKESKEKVCRGGSWTYEVDTIKTYYRFNGETTLRDKGYGFRAARIL
ncbi:MAG: SUMF1/EgtB/PvdO family nonheme iron enzyme [Candidatus Brocadiae bacterium]|nr:SUMF1/EgtB/PvdO family nonheme iron enzyme [Candidatus Brocadiia bacterium]